MTKILSKKYIITGKNQQIMPNFLLQWINYSNFAGYFRCIIVDRCRKLFIIRVLWSR